MFVGERIPPTTDTLSSESGGRSLLRPNGCGRSERLHVSGSVQGHRSSIASVPSLTPLVHGVTGKSVQTRLTCRQPGRICGVGGVRIAGVRSRARLNPRRTSTPAENTGGIPICGRWGASWTGIPALISPSQLPDLVKTWLAEIGDTCETVRCPFSAEWFNPSFWL